MLRGALFFSLLPGLLVLGASTSCMADEALGKAEAAKVIAKVIESNIERFRAIESLHYAGSRSAKFFDDERGLEEQVIRVDYLSAGEKYCFEFREESKPPMRGDKHAKTSYDGAVWGRIDYGDNTLYVSKKDRPKSAAAKGYNFLFSAFSFFLFFNDPEGFFFLDRVSDYAKREHWEKAFGDVKEVRLGTGDDGRPVVEVVTLMRDMVTGEMSWPLRTTFSVDKGLVPVSSEMLGPDGRVSTVYKVDEFTTLDIGGVSIPLPKKATLTEFDKEGKVTERIEYVVESLSVNGEVDEERFSPDLLESANVHDTDENIQIKIPR